ncbi:tumor necrosis factor receptor superfamily member 10B-like isoform X2 [Mixophyes fleayi]
MADSTETRGNLLDNLINNRSSRSIPCNKYEYSYKGICCQYCPAGSHVSDHCTEDHGRGVCIPCTSGLTFTEYLNGMDSCLNCLHCRAEDEVQVAACTPTANSKCQCRPGSYCIPNENCGLFCTTCKSCAAGQHETHQCTATADTVCEETVEMNPPVEFTTLLSILLPLLLLAVCAVIALGIVLWKKRRQNDKERECGIGETERQLLDNGSENNNSTVPTVVISSPVPEQQQEQNVYTGDESVPFSQEDSGHCTEKNRRRLCGEELPHDEVDEDQKPTTAECAEGSAPTPEGCTCCRPDTRCSEPLTDQEWLKCYNSLKDHILPGRWKELMRLLGLSDVDIEHIMMDHSDSREKNYQMFLLWRKQTGRQASMSVVFRRLDEIKLGGCRENIANDLASKGILIV